MAHRRGRFNGPRTPRMNRYWNVLFDGSTNLLNIAFHIVPAGTEPAGTVLFQNFLSEPFDEDVTIARMFLPWIFENDTSPEETNVLFGVGVVSPGASTSSLNPATDAGWDGWMLHRYIFLKNGVINADPSRPGTNNSEGNGTYDVKSMRKIPQGSQLVFSLGVEYVDAPEINDDVLFDVGGRILLLER